MFVVTAKEMRELDRLTIQKYGVPSLTLMERAGEGVARALLECFGPAAKGGPLVVAGKGNNGGDGRELAGAEIGIQPKAVEEVRPQTELLEEQDIRWLIPSREPDTHKGTYGHLLVMAGARGKTGAAILACRAAMRAGSGLDTLAAPRSLNSIFAG